MSQPLLIEPRKLILCCGKEYAADPVNLPQMAPSEVNDAREHYENFDLLTWIAALLS